MRYVTHDFAHPETLSRARRWLIQLGFDADHIEVHNEGTPRLALLVPGDRAEEAELLINAAEMTDPDGWPGFWELSQQTHVIASRPEHDDSLEIHQAQTTAIGWHPPDERAADDLPLFESWDVST